MGIKLTAFLDLFSGIGGFSLGAYWAGLRFGSHYYSEVDPYAIKVYQQRFPDAIPLGDITKIDGRALPAGDWIIAGGFPCQDISVAGKGAGLAGERSGLWFEYARLISEIRPRFAVMENVGALTFRGLTDVLGSLAEIRYNAEWQDIRASDVGAPHRRERIWIVAYPSGEHVRPVYTQGRASLKPGVIHRPIGWAKMQVESAISRNDDGIPRELDSKRIHSLGNSIIPQIAELIFSQEAFDEWRLT